MGKNGSTAVLKKEYDSLSDQNRQLFLELVTKRNCRTLKEQQFWKNFAVVCNFIEAK